MVLVRVSNAHRFSESFRVGFVLMTVSTFLVAGAISTVVWFELSRSHQLTADERVAFLLTGVVETILCLLSIAGFVGVVARKQSFITLYTYTLYAHTILNVITGVYFMVTVLKGNRQQLADYCSLVLASASTESSCTRFTNIWTYVLIAIVATLLLLELYGTVIAIRYVHNLKIQKRGDRCRRLNYFHVPSSKHSRQTSDDVELLGRDGTGASYSAVPHVDLYDPEGRVLDTGLRSPTAYSLVPVYERGLSVLPPTCSPQPSHETLPCDRSKCIGALPVRLSSDFSADVSPSGLEVLGRREPLSPEEEECPASPCTEELSTAAHAALMDHAAYVRPAFSLSPCESLRLYSNLQ